MRCGDRTEVYPLAVLRGFWLTTALWNKSFQIEIVEEDPRCFEFMKLYSTYSNERGLRVGPSKLLLLWESIGFWDKYEDGEFLEEVEGFLKEFIEDDDKAKNFFNKYDAVPWKVAAEYSSHSPVMERLWKLNLRPKLLEWLPQLDDSWSFTDLMDIVQIGRFSDDYPNQQRMKCLTLMFCKSVELQKATPSKTLREIFKGTQEEEQGENKWQAFIALLADMKKELESWFNRDEFETLMKMFHGTKILTPDEVIQIYLRWETANT